MFIIALLAARQTFAQSGSDGETAPLKMSRKGTRSSPSNPFDDDASPETDDGQRLGAPNPRRTASPVAGASKSGSKNRRVTPTAYDEPADPDAPERRQTLNRADITGSQNSKSAASDRWRPAPTDSTPRTFAFAQENGDPGALPAEPTLEEQVAELRARLDQMTQPAQAAPSIGAATTNVSTVPGSAFGPEATGTTGKYLSDGLTFTSQDGNFKTHFGGLVHFDIIGFGTGTPGITSIPGGAGNQTAVEFRRLRMRAEGTMYSNIDWVSEFDFAFALQNTDQRDAAAQVTGLRSFPAGVGVQGGNTINVIQPTTVFMTIKDLPVVSNLRIGNQQNWIGFEHIESARFLDFMERSILMDAFYGPNNNGYMPGISMFRNTEDQMAGVQLGVYKNTVYDSGFTYDIGDAWVYGGRGIWTPYYDEESKGRYMIHTGFGAEYRTFNDNPSPNQAGQNIRIRSRGDLRNVASTLDPNFADTGNFFTGSQLVINPELVGQFGSWLFQSEFANAWFYGARPTKTSKTSLGSVYMQGGYVQVLYFLTGENRVYNRQSGVFVRTLPNENFNYSKGTWGAWQVGVRFDWLDLNSGKFVNGGNEQDMTFGLNWFLNPNARFQFNYVLSWLNNAPAVTFPGTVGALNGSRFVGDGYINTFGGRMDFNF
jgi:phosphate-selective porin OprO/OprP